jgi:hypothetical protein
MNIGLLGNLTDISVRPVLLGNPIGLKDEKWRPLFAGDSRGADAFARTMSTEIATGLKAAGLEVREKSKNEIWVAIYGGRLLGGSCALNTFLVEVWVGEGESSAMARAVVSEATDTELASKLEAAAVEIVDEQIALRARYRESLKRKP